MHFEEHVTIAQRAYLSISHIQSAALFARLAASIENNCKQRTPELFQEHQSYVIGAIFLSVSFLEAVINELFADSADDGEAAKQLDPRTKTLMASLWKLGVPRRAGYPILRKYQIALLLNNRKMFERSLPPCEDVTLLVMLRNALVHYEPETVITFSDADPNLVTMQKFAKKLRGRFALNHMTVEADAFFPDRCLSYGCAKWAVASSLRFADEFFLTMGLPVHYEHVRQSTTC
jgi:hypothetical protein